MTMCYLRTFVFIMEFLGDLTEELSDRHTSQML